MSHIALVIHALHGGGAERVAAVMADQWVAAGKQVTVITLDTVESDAYQVNPQVQRVGLGLMGTSRNKIQALWNNRHRVQALRDAVRDVGPDCVVSVTDRMNIVTLLACGKGQIPVVIAEHSDPRHQHLGPIWEVLRRRTYPHATAVVVLTRAVAHHMRDVVGDKPIYVIPNGVAQLQHVVNPDHRQVEPLIVAMGRLSEEKGFDTLIDAFAEVANRHPAWRMKIAGEGELRSDLQRRIERHELGARVQLVGWLDDPPQLLARAAIFALSSRYEGFPMVLLEAMAHGLAVVSFDCDSGPREIIRHERDGLLVPPGDGKLLALALDRLMADEGLRRQLGVVATQVVGRFSTQQFAQRWEDLFGDVLQPPGN